MHFRSIFVASAATFWAAAAFAQGIPEPPLLFYGTIRNTAVNNQRLTSGRLTWQIRKASTGRTINLSAAVTNYPGFSYVLEVSAETIVSGPVSTNVLDLSATAVVFSHLQVLYGNTPVSFVVATQSAFTASSRQRGRIERVDLNVSLPCDDVDGNGLCDDWELRNFGFVGVDPDGDDDHDGMTNRAEYLAGSDPKDANSTFRFVDVQALPGGTMQVDWESIDGRLYRLWRGTDLVKLISTNLPQAMGLTLLRSNMVATPPVNTFIDTNASSSVRYFYRVELEQ